MLGYVVDSGILITLARYREDSTINDSVIAIRARGKRLVTIRGVLAECRNFPLSLLDQFDILLECAEQPHASSTQMGLLDAFQAGHGRADKAVFAHALARSMDVLTMDEKMKTGSFKDFMRRMNELQSFERPQWRVPKIEVLYLAVHLHGSYANQFRKSRDV